MIKEEIAAHQFQVEIVDFAKEPGVNNVDFRRIVFNCRIYPYAIRSIFGIARI